MTRIKGEGPGWVAPEWVPKGVDVAPDQWTRVRAAAAAEGVQIRVWLRRVLAAALDKENEQ